MSGWRTEAEAMRVVKLTKVKEEVRGMRSLHFEDERCSEGVPGQYVMIWNPAAEEVPMSLASIGEDGKVAVIVRPVGESTEALCGMSAGDKIGLRGPFGNGYTVQGGSPLLVSGGTGAASLKPLAEEMVAKGLKPTFILGARNKDQLLLKERLESLLGEDLLTATDDGSHGYRGYASTYAMQLLKKNNFDMIYTCGPEIMMAAVFQVAEDRGIPMQASLDRYIKCAVGLCGSCGLGPYRVCKDGPVFSSEQLREVRDEFGKRRMDPSGRAVKVDH